MSKIEFVVQSRIDFDGQLYEPEEVIKNSNYVALNGEEAESTIFLDPDSSTAKTLLECGAITLPVDDESGDEESGDEKSGDEKSGDEKSGDEDSGDGESNDDDLIGGAFTDSE